jgi:hypothetical protein
VKYWCWPRAAIASLNSSLRAAEEESFADVHRLHSTRSSGVGRDQVIST